MYPTWLEWSGVLLVITAWPPKIAGAKRGPSYSQMFLCLGNRDRHIQKVMQGTKIRYKITKKKKKRYKANLSMGYRGTPKLFCG